MSYLSRNKACLEQRLRYKFSMCRAHASERGIVFNLTFDEFKEMWENQAGKCGYTGQRMFLAIGKGLQYRNCAVSLERLDPSQPYTKDNCLLVRFDANSTKGRRSFFTPEFIETFPEFVSHALSFKPELQHA